MIAAWGSEKAVELLLQAGLTSEEIPLQDNDGKTALEFADSKEIYNIIEKR